MRWESEDGCIYSFGWDGWGRALWWVRDGSVDLCT